MNPIKTILVPVDFSDVSKNALRYAAHLANHLKAEVVGFHSYRVTTLSQSPESEMEDRQKEAQMELQQEFKAFKKDIDPLDSVDTRFTASLGMAVDEILDKIKVVNPDLVVMGTHGASGLQEKLIGSNTASVLTKATCPVLAIPANAQFNGINKIVFATDYGFIEDPTELELLVEFAKAFDAKIHVLKVEQDEKYVPQFEEAKAVVKFDKYLTNVDHTYHLTTNKDVEEGLNNYIDENDIDLLAMMPRQHNIYERLFGKSVTRKMVYHTHIPVFGFHSK